MRRSSIRGTGQAFAIDQMAFASLPGRSLLEKHSKVQCGEVRTAGYDVVHGSQPHRPAEMYSLSGFSSGSSGSPSSAARLYGDRMECVSANVFVVPLNHHLL